ncbi:GAF and ANTAR domain-containing protein [Mycolicibacterium brisbanense]|uniref:GAF and ANTAR domain-containing protein n=1 Tax=Mycolicibacterium brisbanense TaxID=146020 RepID=UPI000A06E6FC|nr:GAF and ANTAR domain-containing protein [Mycolicibacterium brisbanense]
MNNDRAVRAWTAVAMRARREASPLSPRIACLACVEALGISGAGLLLTTSMKALEPVCVTDGRAGEVEELQARVGEGPAVDALASGRPMLVEDLSATASRRQWPVFSAEAIRRGVQSMFSLPLALGAIRVGVLDLVHEEPIRLDHNQLVDALVYADTALVLTIDARSGITAPGSAESGDGQGPTLWHAEVHQAAGMVSVQLGIAVLDALVRMRAYAFSHDQALTEVARAVVERRLRFHPDDATPTPDHDMEGQP